jgi:hypothetical protein
MKPNKKYFIKLNYRSAKDYTILSDHIVQFILKEYV